MCRLLLVKSDGEFPITGFLKQFSIISKNSKEYQGHGWGLTYLENNEWKTYKNIQPVWEDNLQQFKEVKTKLLLVHARSAFKDQGIVIENNMPFIDGDKTFIFNGELQGVSIKAEGRIGAEKIFNYINRFDKGNLVEAIFKGTNIINDKTKYVKAMNFIISDKNKVYVYSKFNEYPDYFTMHKKICKDKIMICSDPFPEESGWESITNNSIGVY